jgi:hypothetical protein
VLEHCYTNKTDAETRPDRYVKTCVPVFSDGIQHSNCEKGQGPILRVFLFTD